MAVLPDSAASWLDLVNSATDDARIEAELAGCCAARQWVQALMAKRPYPDEQALLAASDAATEQLDGTGLAEALAAHPRIGDRPGGGAEAARSRREQSRVFAARADVRAEIAAANAQYEQRFGRVYLVCATGKSAEELLAICRARLDNDPSTEQRVVLSELAKINRVRLVGLLHQVSS